MHPGNGSVAVCHSCGRPLCLTCAIPVRGEVFGTECLAEVLGPEPVGPPRTIPPRPRDVPLDLVGVGFGGAVVSTVFPWTRFGVASGLFGGWDLWPVHWASAAVLAATAGLILWLVVRARVRNAGPGWAVALLALAGATMAGAILHAYNPPPFTHAWLGPWVALGS